MAKAKMNMYTLADMKDKFIGKRGTNDRELYEYELSMELIGRMIKKVRTDKQLTQAALGELIGVQRAQISKLEHSANSATLGTIIKVFKAMNAEIHFNVSLENDKVTLP